MKVFLKRVKTYLLTSSLLLLVLVPVTSVYANEKGEAGQTGEVEFYLESSSDIPKPKPKPKPKPEPKPEPKPIIKLPQTGNHKTVLPVLLGGALLITSSVVVLERRKSYE
ncbi:LPXTG cell wall anchor domain-containing protein [Vagococcus salmoninarum]|uniref:Gram-positive cocci surface proteins LPxTG domain-containing protein n=1 Tax=Vagococcus salmoninarum TaxID=2739 RepID=A0A429ZCE5_9ENTE|nr:LPXTG cell wall anchor domain-containing protein [Vagococcus salmoninarum]RST91335.1 hypothetical protein CBF35_14510 [Vagococcus salmoninarum]